MSEINVTLGDDGGRIRNWRPVRWLRGRLGQLAHANADDDGDYPMFEPDVAIRQTDTGFEVTVDLPGVSIDDIKVTGVGNRLVIQGQRLPRDSRDEVLLMREQGYGSFWRAFVVPDSARADDARGNLEHGVLTVLIPSRRDTASRRIPIRADIL